MIENKQVTSIYFFHYKGIKSKAYGFGMMQFGHAKIAGTQGLHFYKFMGSGRGNGFNPWPDFSTYCLLCVFDDRESAESFHSASPLLVEARIKCCQIEYLSLKTIKSHGLWSGKNPFSESGYTIQDESIVVLTRATIKWKYLYRFWKYVPTSSKGTENNPDLLYTKGVGEIPVIQMATLSIWKSLEAVKNFAYKSKEHAKAVQMTRKLDWYKEELFARFVLLDRQELL